MTRAIFLAAALFAACGSSKDGWPVDRPRIDELGFNGSSPGDPMNLGFDVEFADGNGDLGTGALHLFLDGTSRSDLQLRQVFEAQMPALALDAPSGTFEFFVRLDESGLEFGVEFEVAVDVEDGDGNRSNRPSLTLVMQPPEG